MTAQFDPTQTSDQARQAALEALLYSSKTPGTDIRHAILKWIHQEPVKWLRQIEVRLLKRCAFEAEDLSGLTALLESPHADVRLEGAGLLRHLVSVTLAGKKGEVRKAYEEHLLPILARNLKMKEADAAWMDLYQTLAALTQTPEGDLLMIECLAAGGEEALFLFAQYAQKHHPAAGLQALLDGYAIAKQDETMLHILRAFRMVLSKSLPPHGYSDTEPVLRTLLGGLACVSENVRQEAAMSLATRARAAKIQKVALPLESEIWEVLFSLYTTRLSARTAPDRDQAKEALRVWPITPERLGKIFELMHRVSDELQKQNVVDLVATFKTAESRGELMKMLKVNFAGLRLEAQKTVINAASGYVPDADIEAELEKLLEGKGLHADIQAKLADTLFADIPSLTERLTRWLRVDQKSKRPALERFELPMMHIKIIESAKKRSTEITLRTLLENLAPLLMMNDAKIKLHETLRDFPASTATLKMGEVSQTLLPLIDRHAQGQVVFSGFTLPSLYGGASALEYGNPEKDQAVGLGPHAAEMAKDFIKKLIQDVFSGEVEDWLPSTTQFQLTQETGTITLTLLPVLPA